jgi:hypothetical protein
LAAVAVQIAAETAPQNSHPTFGIRLLKGRF